MNVVIQKYNQLEKSLGDYLANLTQNPPMGMGSFLKPLNQSFQMCRILGNQMKAQDKRIAELENQLSALKCPTFKPVEVCGNCDSESFDRDYRCTKCGDNCMTTKCKHHLEAANDE